MKQINNPKDFEVCKFDSVNATNVYLGSFDNLVSVNDVLEWSVDKELSRHVGVKAEVLTLREIVSQLKEKYNDDHIMITIFRQEPLNGTIYQYGNYGDSWWEIGTTCGYA